MKKLPVITTLHPLMSSFSPEKWREMGISEEYAQSVLEDYEKREKLHSELGFIKTYSCLPMLMGNLPRKGDCISWIGSCAQILANSIIGAHTNKDGTVINLCSALTGRTPYTGLLRDENRFAQVLVKLADGVTLTGDADYGAMGYYIGTQVANKSVAITNIPKTITFDQLKYMIAPAAASGSIHIMHVVGVTPEAPTVEAAFDGKEPETVIVVTRENLEATKKIFAFDPLVSADLVLLGCPHLTIQEVSQIADLLKGRKLAEGKRLWLAMGEPIYILARSMGYTEIIEQAGGVFSNTCLATIPDSPLPQNVSTVLTNSFKGAHYVKSLQKNRVRVMISDLEDCIRAITIKNEVAVI